MEYWEVELQNLKRPFIRRQVMDYINETDVQS